MSFRHFVYTVFGSVVATAIAVVWVVPWMQSISIWNRLALPVNIYIDDEYRGTINPDTSQNFYIDNQSARFEWTVVNSNGDPIDPPMEGYFTIPVDRGESREIDHVTGQDVYFYPVISNNTEHTCRVAVVPLNNLLPYNPNSNWEDDQYFTGLVVGPNEKKPVGTYYIVAETRQVSLECDGIPYGYWSMHLNIDRVQPPNGIATFIISR